MFRARLIVKEDQLPRETLAWILVAQGFSILPLFFYLPLWLPVIWLAVMFWRIQIYRGIWGFPGNLIKILFGLVCIALLLLTFRGALGVEPMVSFLLCGFILKLVEVYKRKDATILLNICLIALAAQFLFSQTLLATAYVLLCLIILIAALRSVYLTREQSIKKQCKHSVILIAQSLPLMLILFVVMPRISQLWSVPSRENAATTGFSETMSPGSMAQLIKSREVAFRVTFETEEGEVSSLPAPRDRYWRGLTLEYFDGTTWRQRWYQDRGLSGRVQRRTQTPDNWAITATENSERYRYSVILEPHNHTWLFALMTPVRLQSPQQMGAGFHEDKLLVSSRPVSSRIQYQVESVVGYQVDVEKLAVESERRNKQLPGDMNPRAARLVESWEGEGLSSEEIIDAALQLYNREFIYTLNPPLLGANTIDDFLFITRRGFCEHFASSFVYLMRLADIPARVVVGYQGGELNSVENYFMVRQSDAHAWAEVWLEGRGWTRVDPTAAVAPSRIEQGIDNAVEASEAALLGGRFSLAQLSMLVHYWDTLGYKWHRWVLEYDDESQKSLFETLLGGTQIWRVALAFVGVCALLLLSYLAALLLARPHRDIPAEKRLYLRFLRKLEKRGLPRKPGETPSAFAKRAVLLYPQWQQAILQITQLYCHIAYRDKHQMYQHLARAVKQFPPE